MDFLDLALNALASGIALGCIYALVALGLAITFGLLAYPERRASGAASSPEPMRWCWRICAASIRSWPRWC